MGMRGERIMVATSIGPGKEYALPILRFALPRLMEDAHRLLVTHDGEPGDSFGGEVQRLPPADPAWSLFGRCARMREAQRRYFLDSDCDYLYWHDCDMVTPERMIRTLYAQDAMVASGIYNVRGVEGLILPILGFRPAADGTVPEHYGEFCEMESSDGIIEPYAVGMGCMMVRRDVLARIPFRCPEWYEGGMGEDVRWCLDSNIRPKVNLRLTCAHFDADGTVTRPSIEEVA